MKKHFESLDGISIIPFSKVIRITKFVDDGYVRVYYGEQIGFEEYFICSPLSQLEFYLNWLSK